MPEQKYYVVRKGKEIGIFTRWSDCEKQVKGFQGALFKAFKTRKEAEESLLLSEKQFRCLLTSKTTKPKPPLDASSSHYIKDSICVDAACSGNPGKMEYRGVYTATGELLFHQPPLRQGTNNIGEFLAIVHGLFYLKQVGKTIPIYTDSLIGMSWVKQKTVKTTVPRTSVNEELFNLVDRAIYWLENNPYPNKILKWETEIWGEIPADFGRK